MTEISYVADLMLSDLIGGGELNDHELCRLLDKDFSVKRTYCHKLTEQDLDFNTFYIISNFIRLPRNVLNKITDNCRYVIYEHDHKYVRNRDPSKFENYVAPDNQIVNLKFYQNAQSIFCQSSFHAGILKRNLKIENVYNVSGNLWSDDSLALMRKLSRKDKENSYSILNSTTKHKNTKNTIFYCEKKGFNYNLISSNNYEKFLDLLSNNQKFIFLPQTPETLSRVVVEARMMGVKVITNKRVGACYEDWFKLKGEELIDHMTQKKQEVLQKILELING